VGLLGGGDGAPEEPLGREIGSLPGGGASAEVEVVRRRGRGAGRGRRGRGHAEERRDGDGEGKAGGRTLARAARHHDASSWRLQQGAARTGYGSFSKP
jgi:hypothetical protein